MTFRKKGKKQAKKKVVIKQQSPLPVDRRQVRGGLAEKPTALEFLQKNGDPSVNAKSKSWTIG
jgi:hypothetical protein